MDFPSDLVLTRQITSLSGIRFQVWNDAGFACKTPWAEILQPIDVANVDHDHPIFSWLRDNCTNVQYVYGMTMWGFVHQFNLIFSNTDEAMQFKMVCPLSDNFEAIEIETVDVC